MKPGRLDWPPRGWRLLPTHELEQLLTQLDDSTDAHEDVAYEIDCREASAADSRIAQAIGCARGPDNEPS